MKSAKSNPEFQLAFMPSFDREAQLKRMGFPLVAGVDEAGRGPLAGPVVAGAAILSREFATEFFGQINDSKQLTHSQREKLCEEIKKGAMWGLGMCSAAEIDEMNIRRASWEAMRRAIVDLATRFKTPDYVLVDGLPVREMEWPWPYEALVKGDNRSTSIAAGSILAKVTRDAMLQELAEIFPDYGFKKHKGYPTPEHYAALREHGPCKEHRMSFSPVRAEAVRRGLCEPAPETTKITVQRSKATPKAAKPATAE